MKTLIIAPHIDDETIGCWSVLTDKSRDVTVAWGYELTAERINETYSVPAKRIFGFENIKNIESYAEVYVPSRKDWHADHRETNARFRKWATHFYSSDMQNGIYLGADVAETKRKCLDEWFPSQSTLWETNAKYYLFEDIQALDYTTYVTATIGGYAVELPAQYEAAAKKALTDAAAAAGRDERSYYAKPVFDIILSAVPRGRVRMQAGYSEVFETEA